MSPNAGVGGGGVGGFNFILFGNLIGIKGRMIDIGKKLTFNFLQNV
jgi:hypothetical protein